MRKEKEVRPEPKGSGQAFGDSTNMVAQDNLSERLKNRQEEITHNLCEDDVIIFSEYAEENHEFVDNFHFGIATERGKIINFVLNRDQITVIRDLLDDYLRAFEACRRLRKEYPIKARKKYLEGNPEKQGVNAQV